MVPLEESTDIVRLGGYIGKPEIARRSRNHQFLFVNKRYIKNHYLNHAVRMAFENMIPADDFPVFFIFLDIDPDRIDINIHPTKQEIKFEEERLIYNYLRVSVRQALGKYSITPTLDFDKSSDLDQSASGFSASVSGGFSGMSGSRRGKDQDEWQQVFEGLKKSNTDQIPDKDPQVGMFDLAGSLSQEALGDAIEGEVARKEVPVFQLHKRFIVSQIKSGFIVVEQKNAHERILYEKYLRMLAEQKNPSQQELFPISIDFKPENTNLLNELIPGLAELGFNIEHFGQNTFIIKGVPATLKDRTDIEAIVRELIDSYSSNIEFQLGINENLARSFAVSSSVKRTKELSVAEMQQLIDELFACENPYTNPMGKKCFITFDLDSLDRSFTGTNKS
jgi:DNA mismatch repair protein MutL